MATSWNPSDKSASVALSNLNLTATSSSAGSWVKAIDKQTAGKFYWEIISTTATNISTGAGIASAAANLSLGFSNGASSTGTCGVVHNGNIYSNGTYQSLTLSLIGNGTVICIAVDFSAQRAWFRAGAAGNWNANVANNPATGVGGIVHTLGGATAAGPALFENIASEVQTANFGDSAFVGTVPAGFTAGFPPLVVGGTAQAVRAMIIA